MKREETHTASWLFEGTWWRSYKVIYSSFSSLARDQSPGHKKLFDSPIPDSWILNPEAKDPVFNVNKQTNQNKHEYYTVLNKSNGI